MVIFITSIRHPDTAVNLSKLEELHDIMLSSVCSQSDPDFKVIVVCNQIPKVKICDARIIFHLVDFAPPSPIEGTGKTVNMYFRDKGARLMCGLLLSRRFNPDYIFVIDCDDWFNSNIVKFLHSTPRYSVWYSDGGYFANFRSKTVKRKHGMIRYCGSTFAYEASFLMELAQLKAEVDENSSKDELLSASSELFIDEILGDHALGYMHFSSMGTPPQAFPFRTTSWVVGTGENLSQTDGGEFGVPIDRKYCCEFGLPLTFIPALKPSMSTVIREWIGCIRSKIGWIITRRSGKICYE